MRQSAAHGCGYCLIPSGIREDLEYDIVQNGRYHQNHKDARAKLPTMKSRERTKFMGSIGLSKDDTPLLNIALALDIIQTRPSDVGHSEYRGIGKISQELLCTAILTEKAQAE